MLAGCIFFLLVVTISCEPLPYQGHVVLQLTPHTAQQVEWLQNIRENSGELDFWSSPHVSRSMEVRVPPSSRQHFVDLLDERGIKHETLVSNLQEVINQETMSNFASQFGNNAVGVYVRSPQVFAWMDNLAASSKIMSVITIGKSFEGRDLKVAKISSGPGRQALFINSGQHSREWIAHASMIWIVNELVTKYGIEDRITSIVDKYDWYIMPLANPDGYDYSHDKDRFWRKTRSTTASSRCPGADPNRNWDSAFGGEGTSGYVCSDIYRGAKAFSEIETKTISEFLTQIHSQQTLKLYIDVHAYSQLWFTPYGYSDNSYPNDYSELLRVANLGAEAIMKENKTKWKIGTPPQLLYAAAGGAYDWAKQKLGVKYSYALEARPEWGAGMWGFVVDAKQIPASGKEILAGLVKIAQEML